MIRGTAHKATLILLIFLLLEGSILLWLDAILILLVFALAM
jgi:hypothetical protein